VPQSFFGLASPRHEVRNFGAGSFGLARRNVLIQISRCVQEGDALSADVDVAGNAIVPLRDAALSQIAVTPYQNQGASLANKEGGVNLRFRGTPFAPDFSSVSGGSQFAIKLDL
jgi:hypothetical protein